MTKIAILGEHRDIDPRVILLPPEVKQLVSLDYQILIENGAGEKLGFSDQDYFDAGASCLENIADADMIAKIRAPLQSEYDQFRSGQIIFSFFHVNSYPKYQELMHQKGVWAFAWENFRDDFGHRLFGVTEWTGEIGMLEAFHYARKIPQECRVTILGHGEVGTGAIRVASQLGAKIKILGRSKSPDLKKLLPNTDILVNTVLWNPEKEQKKYLMTKDELVLLPAGAVIADLSSDVHGPIESSHPTYLDKPTFIEQGVLHFSLYSIPGLRPFSTVPIYSQQAFQIISRIDHRSGIELKQDPFFAQASI